MFIPWRWRVSQGSTRENTALDPQPSAWGSRGKWRPVSPAAALTPSVLWKEVAKASSPGKHESLRSGERGSEAGSWGGAGWVRPWGLSDRGSSGSKNRIRGGGMGRVEGWAEI